MVLGIAEKTPVAITIKNVSTIDVEIQRLGILVDEVRLMTSSTVEPVIQVNNNRGAFLSLRDCR